MCKSVRRLTVTDPEPLTRPSGAFTPSGHHLFCAVQSPAKADTSSSAAVLPRGGSIRQPRLDTPCGARQPVADGPSYGKHPIVITPRTRSRLPPDRRPAGDEPVCRIRGSPATCRRPAVFGRFPWFPGDWFPGGRSGIWYTARLAKITRTGAEAVGFGGAFAPLPFIRIREISDRWLRRSP